MTDTDSNAEHFRIEFPCQYPIKIIGETIGETDEAASSQIIAVVCRHAPEVTADQISTRKSRNGNYQSIRVDIIATGESQLKALHKDLMALASVRMVL